MQPADDLLRPTLTANDETHGMVAPWNPNTLVVLTFFFGWVPGGALLALNFQRLGMPRHAQAMWVATAVGGVIVALVYSPMIMSGLDAALHGGDLTHNRQVRWGIRGVSAALALVVAYFQQARFRLWMMTHGTTGPLFKPALVTIVIGVLVSLSLLVFARQLA